MSKPKYQDEDYQNQFRPINLPDPSTAQHPATKAYVDAAIVGIRWKTVRALETTNVDISQLNNGDSLGGVTVATGNEVFLSGQTTASQDGIYTVGATAGTTVRSTQLPAGADAKGLGIVVQEGSSGNKLWIQTAEPAIVGTDGLTLTDISGTGTTYTAGDALSESPAGTFNVVTGAGLEVSSDTVRIAAAAAGNGLTGGAGSALAVGAGTGISVNADDVAIDTSLTARWKTWLGPASAGTTITQAHGLGHKEIIIQLRRESDGLDVTDGVQITVDATNIVVTFGASQADLSAFRINAVG